MNLNSFTDLHPIDPSGNYIQSYLHIPGYPSEQTIHYITCKQKKCANLDTNFALLASSAEFISFQ